MTPLFPQLWGLQNTGQSVNGTAGTRATDIKFVNAWSLARTSSPPVVVAVIDTGVDYTHPDLAPNMWTKPRRNGFQRRRLRRERLGG